MIKRVGFPMFNKTKPVVNDLVVVAPRKHPDVKPRTGIVVNVVGARKNEYGEWKRLLAIKLWDDSIRYAWDNCVYVEHEIRQACKDPRCGCTTAIDECLSFGRGELSDYGSWEFPCSICAREHDNNREETKAKLREEMSSNDPQDVEDYLRSMEWINLEAHPLPERHSLDYES